MIAAARSRKVLIVLLVLAALSGCDRTRRPPDMPPLPTGTPEPRTFVPQHAERGTAGIPLNF
jgi:hypothetical protein